LTIAGLLSGLLDLFPAPVVLLIAAGWLMAESGLLIGAVLPGASVAMALGLFARGGAFPLAVAIVTAVVATAAGSQYGYFRGWRVTTAGAGWLTRLVERKLGAEREQRLLDGLRQRARWAAGTAHCVAVVRTLVPRMAGRAQVPYGRFVVSDVIGAVVWGTGVTVIGYLAGAAYESAQRFLGLLGPPLIVAVLAVVVGWRLIVRRRKRMTDLSRTP
jgi:membrane-associated protein